MTSLDSLLGEIQAMTRAEAEELLASVKAEISELDEENQSKIQRETKEIIDRAQAAVPGLFEREEARAKMHERNEILALKQELTRSTAKKAIQAVTALGDEEYFNLLSAWAGRVDVSGKTVIWLNERDLGREKGGFLSSFPPELEPELSQKPADIGGGFLAVCGGITVNCSVEAVFDAYENQINSEIQQALFGRE